MVIVVKGTQKQLDALQKLLDMDWKGGKPKFTIYS